MNRIFVFLAPQSAIGGVTRCMFMLTAICLINLAYGYAFDFGLRRGAMFYLLQGVAVGGPFTALFFAITAYQLNLIRKLSLLSRKDGLTGLNNRRTFLNLAQKRLSRTGMGILLLLDADNFKQVNDQFGHAAGDDCLQQIAHRLNWNLRKNDVAGRIGGEEFAVLLSCASIEQGRVIAERMGQPIPYHTNDRTHHECITLSIGMVILDPLQSLDCHLQRADLALYDAKKSGRACVRVWEPAMAFSLSSVS